VRVVCPLAPLEAFQAHSAANAAAPPHKRFALQPGARIEVLLATSSPADWRTARVVSVVDLLATSAAVEAALRPLLMHGAWALGWPPASPSALPLHADEPQLTAAPAAARSAGASLCVAVLEVDGRALDALTPLWASAAHLSRGAPVALAGAPFGALAPAHFAACVAAGCVANALPHGTSPAAFLLDARTLPGAEGGPVACAATGALVGVLLPPLRPRAHGAPEVSNQSFCPCMIQRLTTTLCAHPQVPLMVAWDALAAALGEPLPRPAFASISQGVTSVSSADAVSPAAVAAACRGVALVSVRDGGAWGSAVCVGGASGLYLTAAHLLHPAAASSGAAATSHRHIGGNDAAADVALSDALPALPGGAVAHAALRGADGVWRRATSAWVCRGALDLALLALDAPLPREGLTQLEPSSDFDYGLDDVAQGAPCAVIGHAQFAPAAALPPAAALGVVSRCVGAADSAASPSMLLTSAAVHAGASGGAVIGRRGQLLGLVTSNARAAGSAHPLPQLNFSVAAPALRRLCAAARDAPPGAALRPGLPGAPAELLAACAALDEPDEALTVCSDSVVFSCFDSLSHRSSA
jgi:S1-C subfamily serine protease